MLVEASRSVASAILDHTGACVTPPNTTGLMSLLAYTDEAFPQSQTYLNEDLANKALALPNVAGRFCGQSIRGPFGGSMKHRLVSRHMSTRVNGRVVGWLGTSSTMLRRL